MHLAIPSAAIPSRHAQTDQRSRADPFDIDRAANPNAAAVPRLRRLRGFKSDGLLEANFRLNGRCVGQTLDQAAAQRGWPRAITVDNGTEFTSKALDEWAYRRGVKLDYTRPGKPTNSGLIESFNGRLRDEFLNVNEFVTMHDAQEKLKAWQDDYNTCRPRGSLGHLTPSEFATMRSGQPVEAANLQFKTVRLPGRRQMPVVLLPKLRNPGTGSMTTRSTSHS